MLVTYGNASKYIWQVGISRAKLYKDWLLAGAVGRLKTDDGTMMKHRSSSALIFDFAIYSAFYYFLVVRNSVTPPVFHLRCWEGHPILCVLHLAAPPR